MSDYNKANVGKVYVSADAVEVSDSLELAAYENDAAFNIAVESIAAHGQNFWPQEYAVVAMMISMNFGGVHFKQATLGTLFDVTATAGSTKENTPVTGTVYKFTNTLSNISNDEYLVSTTRSSDSKKFQIWAANARVNTDLNLAMSKSDFMTHDLGLGLYADASGDVFWTIEES